MKSSIGNALEISLFGESHSEAIGVLINGLPAGIKLDLEFIDGFLEKRKPKGKTGTLRREADELHFLSGYFNGFTTGTPLMLMIENKAQRSADYEKTKGILRPSHADFTAYEKYGGFQDYRGGGHFSGRITAPLVAAGAICMQILNAHGIEIGTHIKKLNSVSDDGFSFDSDSLKEEINLLNKSDFAVLNGEKASEMTALIEKAGAEGDSVGGILETAVIGVKAGIGEPFFDSVESRLSHLLFSIPGIKGVEFGLGFGFADKFGSEANDAFFTDGEEIKTKTNNNGGINGGISNGMPIVFRCAVKPTPSIFKRQESVDYFKKENTEIVINGRHDPAIIHRARIVVDSVCAIALCDLLSSRFGYLWLGENE